MNAFLSHVDSGETLARFIVSARSIRSSDRTIKPDAFIPYPYPDLSVTRHTELTDETLWKIGESVAESVGKSLKGRADLTAEDVRALELDVTPNPLPENRNHAIILGWPPEKSAQKSLAQELAAVARYVPKPDAFVEN